MPTPIGHALAGVALAFATRSRREAPVSSQGLATRFDWWLVALLAGLAAAPDLDLLFREHRTATHSLASVALVTILARAVTGKVTRSPAHAWRLSVLCASAWASHILLDWLGADTSTPRGIQMLWPLSDEWFMSGWDVFRRIERRDLLAPDTIGQNVLAVAQELAIFAPLIWAARKLRREK